ncbi:MAG: PAS domain S-box protein [Chloroflexi bacterium]|nr:PAS domain S-box protein [Chloroflexota bacterium]
MPTKRDKESRRLLEAQVAIAETFAQSLDLEAAAKGALRAVCEALDCGAGAFWVEDAEGTLRCGATFHGSGGAAEALAREWQALSLAPGQGLPGRVRARGRPEWVADAEDDVPSPWSEAAKRVGVRTALAVPLGDARAPLGVLEFLHAEVQEADEELLASVAAIAAQLGAIAGAGPAGSSLHAAIIGAALDAVITIDGDGTIVELNHAAETMFGYEAALAVGKRVDELLIPASLRDAHRAGMEHFRLTGEGPILRTRFESMALRTSGKEFPVEITVTPVRVGGRTLFTAFLREISERKRQDEAVRRANAFKDELLGLISHELRSPLTAILGNVSLLNRLPAGTLPPEAATSLRDIGEYSERLRRVVANMLALARADSAAELDMEPVLLQHLVPTLATRFEAGPAGREVTIDIGPRFPPVLAEPTFVEQVLENLLSNAAKYSAPGKPVHIAARVRDAFAEVTVRDQGDGLRPGELERLFDPFFRAARTAQRSPGIGLGLTVCKRLVETLGGRIWAESPAEGGTLFGFSLRLAGDD